MKIYVIAEKYKRKNAKMRKISEMPYIGTVTIKKDAIGEYWASFSIASEEPFYDMLSKTNTMHGIDLNLIDLVNTSDGESAINKRFYQNAQKN